jgi:hypothetical protein
MRTFILFTSMLALGLAQQICLISGAGAAVSDSKIMERILHAAQHEEGSTPQTMDGVLFDVWEKQGSQETAQGVYYFDLAESDAIPVLPEGFALQDVSDDQTWMLANAGTELWLISLENISSNVVDRQFYSSAEGVSALFVDSRSFVYLQNSGEKVILLENNTALTGGSTWLGGKVLPSQLIDGGNGKVWVRLRACEQSLACTANEELWMVDGKSQKPLTVTAEQFWPAIGSARIAYSNPSINTDLLFFADTLGFASEQLRLSGSYTLDADWRRTGDQLAVLRLIRDFESHEVRGIAQHIIDARTLSVSQYPTLDGLLGQGLWRDENSLLVIYTQENSGKFQLALAETHLQDGSVDQYVLQPAIQNEKLIFVRQIIGISE